MGVGAQRPEEGVRSPETGAKGGCELFNMGAGKQTRFQVLRHFSSHYKTKLFMLLIPQHLSQVIFSFLKKKSSVKISMFMSKNKK